MCVFFMQRLEAATSSDILYLSGQENLILCSKGKVGEF